MDIATESNHIEDVLTFLSHFQRTRRATLQKPLGRKTAELLRDVRISFLSWLSERVERYVFDVYFLEHNVSKPVPALTLHRASSTKRKRVSMDPSTIWTFFEEARAAHIGVRQVLQVRQRDAHAGSHDSIANSWVNKYSSMYDAIIR